MEVDVNVASNLASIGVGDTIRMSDSGDASKYFEYRVTDTPVANVDHYEIPVELVDARGGGPAEGTNTQLLATLPTAGTTQYIKSTEAWDGFQPFYLTAEAYLAYDGVAQSPDSDDLFGVDLYIQQALWLPDWDVVHMPT
jgi:hypothetical protein